MATNTPNLNLVKPDMSDFADIRVLNGNMDILDNEVGGLDYVKNVVKSDSGLTFTKKDNTEIQVPLNYMPTTGGNFTGDITVQNGHVVYIVDSWYSDDNLQYWIKYSNGRLEQGGLFTSTKTTDTLITITFNTPFSDDNYFVFATLYGDRLFHNADVYNTDIDRPPYVHQKKTATNCIIAREDKTFGLYVVVIGRWK